MDSDVGLTSRCFLLLLTLCAGRLLRRLLGHQLVCWTVGLGLLCFLASLSPPPPSPCRWGSQGCFRHRRVVCYVTGIQSLLFSPSLLGVGFPRARLSGCYTGLWPYWSALFCYLYLPVFQPLIRSTPMASRNGSFLPGLRQPLGAAFPGVAPVLLLHSRRCPSMTFLGGVDGFVERPGCDVTGVECGQLPGLSLGRFIWPVRGVTSAKFPFF